MPGGKLWTLRHVTGATLIVGCALFLVGAALYGFVRDPNGPLIFGQPTREWLRIVHEHQRVWQVATILFMCGVLVTTAGLVLLARLLDAAGDPGFSLVGLFAVAFGAAPWIINLAARLTVDPWAGNALAATGSVPEVYAPLSVWTGALFVIYTILTFAGLMLYGGAIASTHLLPQWVGWLALVYGAAGLGVLAVTRDAPPFMHYLTPILFGALLLLG